MKNIGIFPLSLVLFPESHYPLHIFEERYKNLIHDCLNLNVAFGITLSIESKIYDIGCTAKVVEIIREYEDGKMDVIVYGEKRFVMKKMKVGSRLYSEGEIEYFDDDNENEIADLALLHECIDYYNKISEMVRSFEIKKIDPDNIETKYFSYLIAQKAGMSLKQKQELLEIKSENKRLGILAKHLKEMLPMLKNAEKVNQLIKNDGYYSYKI